MESNVRNRGLFRLGTRDIIFAGMFAALIAASAQVSLPIGLIPFTLQTLMVTLAAQVLGAKRGFLAVLSYLLVGAVGAPVFSRFAGGVGVLLGPTGGFLLAFLPAALLTGALADAAHMGRKASRLRLFFVCLPGIAVCGLGGALWLCAFGGFGFSDALMVGVVPFLAGDIAKAAIASAAAPPLRRALDRNAGR